MGENMAPPKKKTVPAPPVSTSQSSAFSLRLPDQLRQSAQKCSESTGVSLNGLVCIALADYLTSRGYRVHSKQ